MTVLPWKPLLVLVLAIAVPSLAQNKNAGTKRRDELKKPLVIASQGSYFVGGESKTLPSAPGRRGFGGGEITINQMYVQYQIPPDGDRHVPVVMVHGCCLSSKTWETTPDGRMGWNEYFVRKGRSVYLADQSSRARSGFDGSTINAVEGRHAAARPAAQRSDGESPDRMDDLPIRACLRPDVSRWAIPHRSRGRTLQTNDPGPEFHASNTRTPHGKTWLHWP